MVVRWSSCCTPRLRSRGPKKSLRSGRPLLVHLMGGHFCCAGKCRATPFSRICTAPSVPMYASASFQVTAYDLPEFRPRGSFCCKDRSDVKARWGGGVGKRLTQVTLPLRPPQNPLFLCPACHACFSSRASFFSRIEVVLRGFPQPSLPPTLVTLTLPSPPLARRPASYESASYRLLG